MRLSLREITCVARCARPSEARSKWKRVSKPARKCPGCSRRVKRAPYLALTDRKTRYHGGDPCSGPRLREGQRRGPAEVVLHFAHLRSCGAPAGRMSCRGDSYKVGDSVKA
jgi:hypothetical protein